MADDELDSVADKLVGDRHALLRVGDVVAGLDLDFLPEIPPALLMSSAACWTPWLSCAPNATLAPVIGPATPILIWRMRRGGEAEGQRQGNGFQNDGPHINLPYETEGLACAD